MSKKFWSLAGVLALAGSSTAQPPGEVERPRVDGREPTPIARDYYEPEAVAHGFGSVPAFPSKSLPRMGEELGEQAANPMYGFTVGHAFGANIPSVHGDVTRPVSDFATGFRNSVLNNMTVPLGTVRIED